MGMKIYKGKACRVMSWREFLNTVRKIEIVKVVANGVLVRVQ